VDILRDILALVASLGPIDAWKIVIVPAIAQQVSVHSQLS